jgi:beta-galactosidase
MDLLSFKSHVEEKMTPDYCNEHVFQRNRLPARSYYIPNTSILLNGVWDFNYAPTPSHAPEPVTTLDSAGHSGIEWSSISVPSHWQFHGYGIPQYTNTVFPFPVCPPHVPTDNPTGTYRRNFQVPNSWVSMQIRLRFEGVDSAYHVWVNGYPVGYSQGSRNPAEFDISPYIERKAVNELFVRVYQWSDGSYIEDQDQWWLSGMSCYSVFLL